MVDLKVTETDRWTNLATSFIKLIVTDAVKKDLAAYDQNHTHNYTILCSDYTHRYHFNASHYVQTDH